MRRRLHRARVLALAAGSLCLLLASCAVTDGGQGYNSNMSIGLGYYAEPWPGDYGGWGPGYRIGPYPGAMQRHEIGRPLPPPRAYRVAPGARPVPSIPSRPRSRGPRTAH